MAHLTSITDPEKKKSSSVTLKFQRGRHKKSFAKADIRTGDPAYGAESKSKPTPEHVIKAQKAGVEVAHHEGKAYRAGYETITKEPDRHSVEINNTPSIPKRAPSQMEVMKTQASTEAIRQKYGKKEKRRLERVPYLQGHGYGRNKRTESGYGN